MRIPKVSAGQWVSGSLRRFSALIALTSALSACEEPGDKVLSIDPAATGTLQIGAILDRDGNGEVNVLVDVVFPGLRINVTPVNGTNIIATGVTDQTGLLTFPNLPVGSYQVRVDSSSAGDSLRVSLIDPTPPIATITTVVDSIGVGVLLEFAVTTVADAVKLPRGRRVTLRVIALNTVNVFGDSTVHLADSSAAVRAYALRTQFQQGDSLRLRATIGERDGKPALTDLTLISIRGGEIPAPIQATTSQAALAGGKLDNNLVQVKNARVVDAATLAGGDNLYTVDDGSGPLEMLFDATAGILTNLPIAIGAELDVTGLLVPRTDGSNRWKLMPRRTGDVFVRYPAITIFQARTRQLGETVLIQGIALNVLNNFLNGAVHVSDATAAIRVFPVGTPQFQPGDSISVLGRVTLSDFQPALSNATISVLARRNLPSPIDLKTAEAASAAGNRDAQLVRIDNATVTDTSRTPAGAMRIVVNDTTGPVAVILETQLIGSFAMPAPGVKLQVIGLLTPVAPGIWAIRPRCSIVGSTSSCSPPDIVAR
ncbi:MAG: prealbumin-like fold domain-containing protein [Gemmatimonadota bacterium]